MRVLHVEAAALRVVDRVVAVAGEHAQVDAVLVRSGGDHAVVAAVQVEPDLVRLLRQEAALVERGPRRAVAVERRERQPQRAVAEVLDGGEVGPVGAAHVDRVGQVLVELPGVGHDPVAPLAQVLRHLRPVDRVPLRRHLAHGLVDDGIGHLARQLPGDLLEDRPLETRQQPARDVVVVRGQPLHPLRVLARVAHEARHHPPHRAHRLALVAREGLVRVLRQGHPDRLAAEARPPPLRLVAVPVADHEVEEARLQEGAARRPGSPGLPPSTSSRGRTSRSPR